MGTSTISIKKLGIISGLFVALALILFFLLMKSLNLHRLIGLHYLNGIFLLGGILLAFNYVKIKTHENINYFHGLLLGILISVVAVIPFSAFIYIYLSRIDPEFMLYIKENGLVGAYLNPSLATAVLVIEGIISGALFSYILMPYFKKNEIESSTKRPATTLSK